MTQPKRNARRVQTIGNRIAPPRFLLFLILLPIAWFGYRAALPMAGWKDHAAVAFDVAALVFLVSLVPLFRDSKPEAIRAHAAQNDANRALILALTTLLTFVVMAAITGEMGGAQRGEPLSLTKLIGTLLLIWLFANGIYAMHYAHAYYAQDAENGGDVGGLNFPGTKTPDYGDFAYFACTLGMTFQTSDVEIASVGMRRVALFHSFAAFVFNIGVIAFTINLLAGSSS